MTSSSLQPSDAGVTTGALVSEGLAFDARQVNQAQDVSSLFSSKKASLLMYQESLRVKGFKVL